MKEILSTIWKTVFFNPFLNILMLFYAILWDNMGLAVIAMAIVVRLALLPSTKRQIAMTNSMSSIRPKLDEIQKKYKNNPEQLSKEQMKLYKESGYSPVGCLGTFLPQIFIIAAIFGVIRTISTGDFSGLYEPVANFVFPDGNFVIQNTQFLIWDLGKSFNSFTGSILSTERIPYLILAFAVGLTQFVSTKFSQGVQNSNKPKKEENKDAPMGQQEMTAQMSKSMVAILPVMTAYFTLSQPSVLGIYWFAQSVMLIVQYFIIDRKSSISLMKSMLPGGKEVEQNSVNKKKKDVKEIEVKKVDETEKQEKVSTAPTTQKSKKKKKKKKKKRKKS